MKREFYASANLIIKLEQPIARNLLRERGLSLARFLAYRDPSTKKDDKVNNYVLFYHSILKQPSKSTFTRSSFTPNFSKVFLVQLIFLSACRMNA